MDETLLLLVNGCHNAYWDEFMWMLTYRFTWVPLYVALAYAIMHTLGWRRGLMFVLAIGLSTLLADQVGSHVIRPMAERLRPSNLDNPLSSAIHIVHDYRGGVFGMPSCHAANTVSLLTMMCLQFRCRWLNSLLALWMLSQVYSRMYLGVHYPTDLLVGSLLGCITAVIMVFAYRYSVRRYDLGEWGREDMKYPHWLVPAAVLKLTVIAIFVLSLLS